MAKEQPPIRRKLKILIADDTSIVLDRLSLMISEIDLVNVVGLAKDTSEAISLFNTHVPDAVVLDIQMPGGSGLDVLRHIKRINLGTTVVMMTSSPYPPYREAAMRGGADFFVDKSADLAGIVMVIKDLAGAHIYTTDS